ncbi:MAG: radical SAM protein [Desulfobacteraceae bacterium]|nr:MAG: radical SAM protein [Desulfobacteraceae bacterium]
MDLLKTNRDCDKEIKEEKNWKFSDILAEPVIRKRWEKVRKYFFLRESTYDMTNRCNVRCDGCYYYEGEKQFAKESRDADAWRSLMQSERARGITYVVLAGAEPSLVPELCQVCFEELPMGAIASNGLKVIPRSVDYRIHISVWGNDATSLRIRHSGDMLRRQMENYSGDPRAVFVYTFTRENIEQVHEVAGALVENGCRLTFNVFSAPVGYTGPLRHTPGSLAQTRKAMIDLLSGYPDHVLFSRYSAVAHTHRKSLHDLYSCLYPRVNPTSDPGLGRSFRQYRTDLTWDRSASCCVPDTDCADCRHYASGSAVVTARMFRHATDPETFKAWLDYADTYLAVWVMGYEKGPNLCRHLVAPPGNTLL